MQQKIKLFMSIFCLTVAAETAHCQDNVDRADDAPIEADYRTAAHYRFSRVDVWFENRRRAGTVDVEAIQKAVVRDLGEPTKLPSAKRLDAVVESTIHRGAAALREMGEGTEADRIEAEYAVAYTGYFVRQYENGGIPVEIGDHAPLNLWLELVHAALHIKLGDDLCRYLHVHDLFIVNFAVPVVFNPKRYDLLDYKDHFAGHPLSAWKWEHHGLAGVVTFWAVNITCGAATFGMGLVTFACSPIAGLAESVMDRRIAPPVAERVWKRSNAR